jgi:hypothetical protein
MISLCSPHSNCCQNQYSCMPRIMCVPSKNNSTLSRSSCGLVITGGCILRRTILAVSMERGNPEFRGKAELNRKDLLCRHTCSLIPGTSMPVLRYANCDTRFGCISYRTTHALQQLLSYITAHQNITQYPTPHQIMYYSKAECFIYGLFNDAVSSSDQIT